MKRTLTINLEGVAFTIDVDAYELLKDYLHQTEVHFTAEEEKEILSDIEIRISELFTERLGTNRQVVDVDDVNYAIATLGSPDQYDDNVDNEEAQSKESKKAERAEKRKHRRFYRDPDNQVLGGVASGLAYYLGWDVTLVRLLFIILTIIGFGYTVIAYLAVWLIAPEARTVSQKLEMNGVEPSIENMRKYMMSEEFKSSATKIGSRLGEIFIWLFRIVAIIVGITFAAAAIFLVGVLIYVIIMAFITDGFTELAFLFPGLEMTPLKWVLILLCMLLCLIIPVVAIINVTIKLLRREKYQETDHRHKYWGWIWLAIWLISGITMITIISVSEINRHNPFKQNISQYHSQNSITEKSIVGAEFDKISASNGVNVILVKDSISYVEISGDESILRHVTAEVKGSTLKIGMSIGHVNRYNFTPNSPTVTVHYTELIAIDANSAADVTNLVDTLYTDALTISTSSDSDVKLNVVCKQIEATCTSAGEIELKGNTDRLSINSTSAAKVDTKELKANYATAEATSSAKIILTADTVDLKATSASTIKYNRTAIVVSSTATSAGKIKTHKEQTDIDNEQ